MFRSHLLIHYRCIWTTHICNNTHKATYCATKIPFPPPAFLINYQYALWVWKPHTRKGHTFCHSFHLACPARNIHHLSQTASDEFLPVSYYLQNLSHGSNMLGQWVIINSILTYQRLKEIFYCNFQHKMKHPSRSQSWRNLLWEEWFQVIYHYEMKMQKPLKTPETIQINPCCKVRDQWGFIFGSTSSNKHRGTKSPFIYYSSLSGC